jgi:putative restriction endonuclease
LAGSGLILQAAHILSWKDCKTDQQRLDPNNGILLHASLHHAFDSGLISFDKAGKLLLAAAFTAANAAKIGITLPMSLPVATLNSTRLDYLRQHRIKYGFLP